MIEREEIVKALRSWNCKDVSACSECGFGSVGECVTLIEEAPKMLESDAAEIARLKSEIAAIRQNSVSMEVYQQVVSERDAAVEDMDHVVAGIKSCNYHLNGGSDTVSMLNLGMCGVCKGNCHTHDSGCKFEWRGLQKERADENLAKSKF